MHLRMEFDSGVGPTCFYFGHISAISRQILIVLKAKLAYLIHMIKVSTYLATTYYSRKLWLAETFLAICQPFQVGF